jgi:glucosamine--fructose-6-phosphate aminotransferase (isomerizing)
MPRCDDHVLALRQCGEVIRADRVQDHAQLLAYHVAALCGTDVDQPQNLAKSVTVEYFRPFLRMVVKGNKQYNWVI